MREMMEKEKNKPEDGYKNWLSSYYGIYIQDVSKFPSSYTSSSWWPSSESTFNIAVIAAAIH